LEWRAKKLKRGNEKNNGQRSSHLQTTKLFGAGFRGGGGKVAFMVVRIKEKEGSRRIPKARKCFRMERRRISSCTEAL